MTKEIIKYSNSILKQKSVQVNEITEQIKILCQEMIKALEQNQGIGLAAPQIGELKRIIVVKEEGVEIFINPKIIKKSEETTIEEEGCLSVPGFYLKIKRPKKIELEAINLKGEKLKIKTEGLLARIFQHEIDHLDGILLTDRITFWQKIKIRKKLKNVFC